MAFFTENGEQVIIYINGERINGSPEASVVAQGITGDAAQVRVTFEDGSHPAITKNMMLDVGNIMKTVIRKNRKGKYVLRPVASVPRSATDSQPVYTASHTTTSYTSEEGTQPTESQTASVTTGDTEDDILGLKVSKDGEVSLNMKLPAHETMDDSQDSPTQDEPAPRTSTNTNLTARVEGKKIVLSDGRTLNWAYTKTKKLTGVEIEMLEPVGAMVAISYDDKLAKETDVPFFYREPDWKRSRDYFKLTVREQSGATWSVKLQHSSNYRILIDGLTGGATQPLPDAPAQPVVEAPVSSGCQGITDTDFQRAVASINKKPFADEKMTIAQQIIRANCFSVSQVKKMMGTFTYEEDKLKIAKSAYPKTLDKGNYYQVNDALTYSDSIEALNAYLEGQ